MRHRRRLKRPQREGGSRPRVADAIAVVRESREAHARATHRGVHRRSLTGSFLFHAMLLMLIIMLRPTSAELGMLTEIAYIDEAALHPAPVAAAPVEHEAPAPGAPTPSPKETRFTRDPERAEQEPVPQDDYTLSDQLTSRLAAMRSSAQRPTSGLPAPDLPSRSSASLANATVPSPRIALQRGTEEATRVPSISLRRSKSKAPARVSPVALPSRSAAKPSSAGGDATARVRLAGAELSGPVANRPIVFHKAPAYPDWAKREGIEASVTLHFVVRPDGSIKENILVERTSGYGDFDDRALEALSHWRFAPLEQGRTGEQWGLITLHFRLRETKS